MTARPSESAMTALEEEEAARPTRPAAQPGPVPLPTRSDDALARIAELVAGTPESQSGDEGAILDDVRRIIAETGRTVEGLQ